MINYNTILYLNDSINALPVDTQAGQFPMLKTDTALVADTITKLEQLPKVFRIPKLFNPTDTILDSVVVSSNNSVEKLQQGFAGILHPVVPQSESWVFGIIIIFFLILVFSISSSSSLINETIKTFFQVKSRSSIFSKTTINDFRFKFFLILFSIGVLSLYSYILIYPNDTDFSIQGFGLIMSITLLFFVLKSIVISFVGYVFIDTVPLKMAKDSYFNTLSFLGIVLFPILVFRIYTPFNIIEILDYISFFSVFLAYIFVTIKLFQIFYQKTVAFFYIFLYLCTLEFLPLIALYLVYKLTV